MDNAHKMKNLLENLSENQKKEFLEFLIFLDCRVKQETPNIQEPSAVCHHQDD
uniref:DUF2281 domain-containing protein n=1 Tax=uncultured Bacillota bacterium TaxID=344338 RepID=A0A650F529_9FIRM|nr:hypothetical protein Firmicute1046_3510 [uncultured Firmicutes bacterium]